MSDELLPCGHCGGHASFVKREAGMRGTLGHDSWYAVRCNVCGVTLGESDRRFRSRAEVATAWNRRAKPQTPLALATDITQNTDVRATVGEDASWLPLASAPYDGTEVELLIYHQNYHIAMPDSKHNWEQIVRGSYIKFNGGGWTWSGLAGTAVGWRAADKGEASNTDQPCDAEKYECKPEDAQYQVVVDRRDLFAFLRAAWREGHSNKQNYSEGEASDYAVAKIKAWKTMLPASRPDLTDGEILDIFVNTNGENKADYMCNVGRAIILASHRQTSATAKTLVPADALPSNEVIRATDTGDKS